MLNLYFASLIGASNKYVCGNMGVLKVLGTWNNFSVNIELLAFIVDRMEQL